LRLRGLAGRAGAEQTAEDLTADKCFNHGCFPSSAALIAVCNAAYLLGLMY